LETILRYKESKEKSAELLRRSLALMGQHDAAFNPVSFTVWYEYAAGMNARLSHAIGVALLTEPRLSDSTVSLLYQTHVADVDSAGMQRISTELQRMMQGLADSASRTGDQAGEFGTQLNGLSDALSSNNASEMASFVTDALAGTVRMKSSARELEQQVAHSRQEIERLQVDLNRARDEAMLDPLTRVLNRKGFDQKMADLLAQPPESDGSHCLIMLDIDHFKKVNDTHGHVMGDRVIQALGEVLRSCAPDKAHSVARYGGEEFAILMPNSTLEGSMKLAETVRQRTRAMKIRDRRTQEVVLTVSISGGVAAMRHGDDAHGLIERADAALYQSKQTGRDRVTCAA
jgi:diguanylate cyclase